MKIHLPILLLLMLQAFGPISLAQSTSGEKALHTTDTSCISFQNSINYIVLIRHGKPIINKKKCLNRKAMQNYLRAYDTVKVEPFQENIFCDKDKIDIVYTSALTRSKNTAQQLFEGHDIPIHENKIFNEFQRKVLDFPNIKMPFSFWSYNSRILWILGTNHRGIESFREAKDRARHCADFLEDQARQHKHVVLVAHGFMNRYIKKYLKQRDWNVDNRNGKEYLGVYLLTKEIKK